MARYARITTIAHRPVEPGPQWIERTRESLVKHLRLAAEGKPDLVVFPETLNATGLPAGHPAIGTSGTAVTTPAP